MIKKFDEFILDYEENKLEEERNLKDIIGATAIASSLMFGSLCTLHHLMKSDKENEDVKTEIVSNTVTKQYYPSQEILDYIKSVEGLHNGWENDGKGNLTTGYGFKETEELRKLYPKGMNKEQAEKYFNEVAIPERVADFIKCVPNIDKYTQRQLDALFDLFYNVGRSCFKYESKNLQKALKNMDFGRIAKEMDHDYNNKKLPGLKIRRDFERKLFLQDVDSNTNNIKE